MVNWLCHLEFEMSLSNLIILMHYNIMYNIIYKNDDLLNYANSYKNIFYYILPVLRFNIQVIEYECSSQYL